MKKCSNCNIIKEDEDFHFKGSGKRRCVCKKCYNSNWKYRVLNGVIGRETRKREETESDKSKEKRFRDKEVNGNFLEDLKEKQNGMCYWLNIPIDFTMEDRLRKPSLDRLDNNIGYRKDNVVLTTIFANTGRRDATIEEMLKFISDYL
jgi:hypothetical protein